MKNILDALGKNAYHRCKNAFTYTTSIVTLNRSSLLILILLVFTACKLYELAACICVVYVGYTMKRLADNHISNSKVNRYYEKAPELLRSIISDSINEYYIYHFTNMTGKIPYINPEQEIEINHGVVDILVKRLEGSAPLEIFNSYYGYNFMDILAVQANLMISQFVIDLNSMEPERKKQKLKGLKRLDNSEDLTDIISKIGFSEK